jgi:hypothetical protein
MAISQKANPDHDKYWLNDNGTGTISPPDITKVSAGFQAPACELVSLNILPQVFSRGSDDTGSWSFQTGFPGWSLGTSVLVKINDTGRSGPR